MRSIAQGLQMIKEVIKMIMQLKMRPLCEFSNFVVEEMPFLLEEDSSKIPIRVKTLVEILDFENLAEVNGSNRRPLALLDLKMAEVAIIRTSPENGPFPVPQKLTTLVDWFMDNGGIPGLQYHDLVEVNPRCDMRAFTTGKARNAELMFYNNHRIIEEHLNRIVLAVDEFLIDPSHEKNLPDNYESLFDFDPIRTLMVELIEMHPDEEFKMFRKFLQKPCPVRDVMGPSGAYTWRAPYLETRFWGKLLPTEYKTQIEKNLKYFSQEGREKLDIIFATKDAPCILDYVKGMSNIENTIRYEIAFMQSFRAMHHGMVRKQLPGVHSGQDDGTGTFETKKFLDNRRGSMNELHDWFKKEYPRGS